MANVSRILSLMLGGLLMFGFISAKAAEPQKGSAYDYRFTTLIGEKPLPLSQFKGKVILIVNTASQCGFTKQYDGLQKLYNQYNDKGFVILGVPSNDFGSQEPGSSDEIAQFCKLNYGVTFPMASKQVVSGDTAHPFYLWARETLGFGTAPKWNFHKYLVGRDGELIDYFNSTTAPDNERLVKAVAAALAKPATPK
jgi:glutathione peroxidase